MATISALLRTTCLVSLAAFQGAPLLAQASEQPPQDASAAQPLGDEIVVTGSRIARSGATTATPTVMLGEQELESAGSVAAGDVLRQLPAVAPGLNSESSGVTFNGAGLDLVDLRSLGTNRTLVLVNGRRQVGSNPNTTAVDLNTIPSPMIERLEVITGGASAIYGADAVSGVLNVILKRDFEGLQIDAQGGVSSRGDAERYAFSGLAGANFADDRGNIMAFAGYSHEGGIDYLARPGARTGTSYVANPASKGPRDGIPDFIILPNVRQIGGQLQSAFILDRGKGREAFAFNEDGSVRPFLLGPSGLIGGGVFTDGGEAELGYDAQCPQAKCALKIPVERYLIAANANYELSDSADLFLEGRFANTASSARFGSVFEIPPVTNNIRIDNPFVSPSLRALMEQARVTSIGILRSDQELGLRGQDAERSVFQLVGGSRGALGIGDFKYEASVQYGSTQFTNTRVNDVDQARFQNALDVVRDPDGVIRCRSTVARAEGCVPINFLQSDVAISDTALSYIRIPFATESAKLTQFVTSGSVTGTLGDLWGAGAISVAVGAEYREEESVYLTSPIDQQGKGFFFTRRQSTQGGYNVREVFGEVIVPLLSDLPFAHSLEVDGAVRLSDYSTSGKTTSWKIGGSYAPVRDVRFRAVLARAVRAPNVGELFAPGSEGFITVDDPCDVNFIGGGTGRRSQNCSSLGVPANFISNARNINIRTSTSGNAALNVEKADTLTAGVVFMPRFLPAFAMTVDYFNIKIADAINVFSAQDILNNCVDVETADNPFCDSITRSPNGDIAQIRRQNINVSRLDREGIDVELRYRQDLGDLGTLDFNAVGTRMLKVSTIVAPGTLTGGTVIDFNGEFGFPKWKGRLSTRYNLEPFELTGTLTYFSSMVRDNQPTNPEDNRATNESGDHFLFNTQAAFEISPKFRFFFGIDNLFDQQPPSLPDTRLGGAGAIAGVEIYPITGRYFYSGIKLNL